MINETLKYFFKTKQKKCSRPWFLIVVNNQSNEITASSGKKFSSIITSLL